MIFIYNLLFIIVIGIFNRNKINYDEKKKKKFLFLCFFQMALLHGLRSFEVGTDTIPVYTSIYENFQSSDYYAWKYSHFEIGFQLFYKLLRYLNISTHLMLLIMGLCIMQGFAIYIFQNSKDVFLSTFMFASVFFPNSLNVLRQYLAVSIAINSYQYIKQKKYLTAIILVALGSSIHIIAILTLLPMIIGFIKNWKLLRNIMIFISGFFHLFGEQIVSFFLTIAGKTYYLSGFNVNRIIRMTTILTLAIALLTWYFTKTETEHENKIEMNNLSCVAFVNFLAGILYLRFEFMSRVIEVINLYVLTMIPLGLRTAKFKNKKLIKMLIYIILVFLMFMDVYNSGSGVEEYKFFWM